LVVGETAQVSKKPPLGRRPVIVAAHVVDEVDVEALDVANARLARGQGRRRLRVGRVAAALLRQSGHHELGFSSVAGYSHERVGRSAAWLYESRRVALQLAELPACEEALGRGEITWKMAALLGRHATPEDEVIMLAAARRSTLREMTALLADCELARETAEEDDDGQRMCMVVRQVEVGTLWDTEVTRRIVAHLEGGDLGAGWIEPVLDEAMSTMQNAGVDPWIGRVGEECGRLLGRRREQTAARERLEEMAEERLDVEGRPSTDSLGLREDLDDWPLPTDPAGLDAELRQLCAGLDNADAWLGGGLERFRRAGGHTRLGYASFDHYARERLGLGRSAVYSKMKLAREAERMPEIGEALRRGAVDQEAAMLVARVAAPHTVQAWLERASGRTYKHLREEVELVETRRRVEGAAAGAALPPSDEEVAAFFELESAMLSGEMVKEALTEKGVRMCQQLPGVVGERAEGDVCTKATGRREVRFRVPEDVFVQFRMAEVAFGGSGLPGEFLSYVCRTFWWVWGPSLGVSDKWEMVYRRDGYRCASPVCRRRDVTLHHLQYRSAGGGDDGDNVLSVCAWCHLEGEHGGRLKVRPPSGMPRWELGRSGQGPVVVVTGRERAVGGRAP